MIEAIRVRQGGPRSWYGQEHGPRHTPVGLEELRTTTQLEELDTKVEPGS